MKRGKKGNGRREISNGLDGENWTNKEKRNGTQMVEGEKWQTMGMREREKKDKEKETV